MHAECLDPLDAAGIGQLLLLFEIDLKISDVSIVRHINNFIWYRLNVRLSIELGLVALLLLLRHEDLLLQFVLLRLLFSSRFLEELGVFSRLVLVLPFADVEVLTVGGGWSLLVRNFLFFLSLGLALVAIQTLASVPLQTTLKSKYNLHRSSAPGNSP